MALNRSKQEKLGRLYDRGLAAEKAGDLAGAGETYRACLALDPDDHCGASVRLAALGLADAPEAGAPEAYVATLFDQHAEVFDDILVRQLGYGVPVLIRDALKRLDAGPFSRWLDLGCGTGLVGQALADMGGTVIGIDIAEAMVEIAHERGVYDELYVGEAVAFLEEGDEAPFDLVVAADMLPYLGRLDAFMAGLSRMTADKGLIAFSTETLPEAELRGRDFAVGRHHRFHHGEAYVRQVLSQSGFSVLVFDPIIVRQDSGLPQPGHLVVARKVTNP